MTAWSAKVWSSAICVVGKGPTISRDTPMAPMTRPWCWSGNGDLAPGSELTCDGPRVRRGLKIWDVHDDPVEHRPLRRVLPTRYQRESARQPRDRLGVDVVVRGQVQPRPVVAGDDGALGLAEGQRVARDRVEDRLLVTWGGRDEVQDLGGGGLLLARRVGGRRRWAHGRGGVTRLLERAPGLALAGQRTAKPRVLVRDRALRSVRRRGRVAAFSLAPAFFRAIAYAPPRRTEAATSARTSASSASRP